jgi:hypothetical protein
MPGPYEVIGIKMPSEKVTNLIELTIFHDTCEIQGGHGRFDIRTEDKDLIRYSMHCRCCGMGFVVEGEETMQQVLNSVNHNKPAIVPMIKTESTFYGSEYKSETLVGIYINGNPKWIQIDECKFNWMFSKYYD